MLADGVALRNRCPQGQADPRAAIAGGASGVTRRGCGPARAIARHSGPGTLGSDTTPRRARHSGPGTLGSDTTSADDGPTSPRRRPVSPGGAALDAGPAAVRRSEEHTSELQSLAYLVCRLLLEKKKNKTTAPTPAQLPLHRPPARRPP